MRRLAAMFLVGGCGSSPAPRAIPPDAGPADAALCAPPAVTPAPSVRCAHPWFAGELSVAIPEEQWGTESRMAAGDLDADGKPDVVVPGGGNRLALILGRGFGSFAPPILLDVSYYAAQVAIGDLDGDGVPDIASLGRKAYGPGDVDILVNEGGGSFAPAVTFATGDEPMSLAMADLDGDGARDLVVANLGNGNPTVTVLYNDGHAGFTRQRTFPTEGRLTGGAIYAAAADVNGDGRVDVVAANSNATVAVLLGQPDGFSAPATIPLVSRAVAITIADVDGDGAPDLVLSLPFAVFDNIAVLRNAGGGGFGEPVYHGSGHSLNEVAAADLDGDGDADLVAVDQVSSGVLVNDGSGRFAGRPVEELGAAHSVALPDLDANGVPDLVLLQGGRISAFLSDGRVGLVGVQRLSPPSETPLLVHDLDRDGQLDVLGSYFLMLRKGDGSFTTPRSAPSATQNQLDDLDGDGVLDLVVTRADPLDVVEIWKGECGGTFSLALRHEVDLRLSSIATGDLDGDSRRDVVVVATDPRADSPAPVTSLVVLRNTGGSFAASLVPDTPRDIRLADFNEDGHDDVAGVVGKFGTLALALGRGDGTFAPATYPGGGSVGVVADFDGDGHLDLTVGEGVMLGNGDGSFRPTIRSSFGSATGDLDGDGHLDLAGDGVALGRGDGTFTFLGRYSPMRRGAAIADLDGDGLADILTQDGILLRQICRGD